MFSKSMTPLFTREFSIAFHKNDTTTMRELIEKLLPQFFFLTAFMAMYVFINIEQFVSLFGGSDFRDGSASIAIMCLFPIHQTLGQLTGSIYYASEQTKTYSKIGILSMLTGLVLTFLFLAPEKFGAFNLAAYGLSLKMVINQFFIVNIQLYFCCKFFRVYFLKLIINQFLILFLFFISAFATKIIAMFSVDNAILQLLYGGGLYTLIIALTVYLFPNIVMISRAELNQYIIFAKRKLIK